MGFSVRADPLEYTEELLNVHGWICENLALSALLNEHTPKMCISRTLRTIKMKHRWFIQVLLQEMKPFSHTTCPCARLDRTAIFQKWWCYQGMYHRNGESYILLAWDSFSWRFALVLYQESFMSH